jgi:Ni2+-binding GTPase involved in maturation of urease and hydrogenase
MDMRRPESLNLEREAARANRQLLTEAGIFTVNLIGGAGCGKTSLLAATLQHLGFTRRE